MASNMIIRALVIIANLFFSRALPQHQQSLFSSRWRSRLVDTSPSAVQANFSLCSRKFHQFCLTHAARRCFPWQKSLKFVWWNGVQDECGPNSQVAAARCESRDPVEPRPPHRYFPLLRRAFEVVVVCIKLTRVRCHYIKGSVLLLSRAQFVLYFTKRY